MLWLQRRLMFFPEVLGDADALSFSVPHEERWFTPPSTGNRLHAITVRSRRAPRIGTIVYWHGNAGSLRSWGEVGAELASFGYDVVVVDYAGFGKSRGTLSEPAILADAQHVYETLRSEVGSERELVVFGRSLGTGPATYLASRPGNAPRLLILETPYASIVDVAQRWMPALPSWIMPIQFRSDVWMRDVRCPVHVFHGTADRVIPFASAQLLQPLLPPSSTFTVIPGGGHSDLAAFAKYRDALTRALAHAPAGT